MMRIMINALHTHTGGGLVYLNEILARLPQEAGLEWHVACQARHQDMLAVPGFMTVHALQPPKNRLLLLLWEQVVFPFWCRKQGVDTVFCNANYAPLLAPKPMICLHNTLKATAPGLRLYWWGLRLLTKLSLCRSVAIFSVAQHIVGEYTRAKALLAKVKIAPPGVTPPPDIQLPIGRDPDLVVAVGNVYPQKQYPLLIQAFALLRQERPNSRLMIVGEAGPDGQAEWVKMQALIAEHGLADAVTLVGAQSHAEVLKSLRKAGVFVSCARAEAFNMPLLEAMALGTAIVASDLPHYRDEIAGDGLVYVPVSQGGDVAAAFAVALYGVLENPVLAEQVGQYAQAKAQAFTWERTVAVIMAEIRALAAA